MQPDTGWIPVFLLYPKNDRGILHLRTQDGGEHEACRQARVYSDLDILIKILEWQHLCLPF